MRGPLILVLDRYADLVCAQLDPTVLVIRVAAMDQRDLSANLSSLMAAFGSRLDQMH